MRGMRAKSNAIGCENIVYGKVAWWARRERREECLVEKDERLETERQGSREAETKIRAFNAETQRH
jgi:hypothetical protein